MKKALILGSNGLLGQSLVKRFINDYKIFAVSLEEENYLTDLDITYQKIDLTVRVQVKEILNKVKPDVIINAAAFTDVDRSELERELCWETNVKAVENIIEGCDSVKPIFVQISTDYVFDGMSAPYKEIDKPNPHGNYARSKTAAENIIKTSNLEYLIIRSQILYGTGNRVRRNFVTWVIDQLNKKNKINVVSDQVGNPTYVHDVSEGIFRLLKLQNYGLFHLSSPDSYSRYDFALKIAEVFELDAKLINRIKTRDLKQKAPRPMNSAFILDKLVNYSGWQPHDVISGLKLLKEELEK